MDSIALMVEMLQRAFPNGLNDSEYLGVLACLYEDMSDENLSKVVAQFTGRNRLDVSNDIPVALSSIKANRATVEEVSARLRNAGWEPEELDDD